MHLKCSPDYCKIVASKEVASGSEGGTSDPGNKGMASDPTDSATAGDHTGVGNKGVDDVHSKPTCSLVVPAKKDSKNFF